MSARLPPKARLRIFRFGFTCSQGGCHGELADRHGNVSFNDASYPNAGEWSGFLTCQSCGTVHVISSKDEQKIRK
jgi:hypothetical protein